MYCGAGRDDRNNRPSRTGVASRGRAGRGRHGGATHRLARQQTLVDAQSQLEYNPATSGQPLRMDQRPMSDPDHAWFLELQQYCQECHRQRPIPERERLSAAEDVQCTYIGGSLFAWLERTGPQFLRERKSRHKVMGLTPNPGVVFTSNTAGLVAAADVLESRQGTVAFLLEDEFQQWLAESPDEQYKWHVHVRSFFRQHPDAAFLQQAKKRYPLAPGSVYWQQSESTMWGKLAGKGVEHLWRWDGERVELVAEAFLSWVP